MFNEAMDNFEKEVEKYAKKNIINKLEKQGINYKLLADAVFNDLVVDEIEILSSDSTKVGSGIVIGILLSLVTGI